MLSILKATTSNKWGKQNKLSPHSNLSLAPFWNMQIPIIWSPIIPKTNIKKLQTIQNTTLQIATGCTRNTNTQHLHNETKLLPMDTHLKLHATQLKQLIQTQTHHLHDDLNAYSNP